MSSRISALMDGQEPHEAVAAAVGAELSSSIGRIENELFAVIDHCQAQRAGSLRENIGVVETLLARFPPAKASKWKKPLGELRVFLLLFEPYMLALPASKSFDPCITFEVTDRRTGKAGKVAMPPTTPVIFAAEMEALHKKFTKARVALIGG